MGNMAGLNITELISWERLIMLYCKIESWERNCLLGKPKLVPKMEENTKGDETV